MVCDFPLIREEVKICSKIVFGAHTLQKNNAVLVKTDGQTGQTDKFSDTIYFLKKSNF